MVVDKPFTATVAEADELIEIAARQKRVLAASSTTAAGIPIISPCVTCGRPWASVLLFEANWDRFRPAIKQGWREVPQDGAGLVNDLGPHLIDQTLQLFGSPDAVEADILAQREAAAVDDYFDVTLHYSRARVCLRSSSLVAAGRPRFAVHGTRGSYVKLGFDPQESQLKAGLDPVIGLRHRPTARHFRPSRRRERNRDVQARQLSRLL